MAAELGQRAAQFRLKNNDQRDRDEDRKTSDDKADDDEIQQLRDECEREENNRQAGQHFRAARAAKIKIAVINYHAQEQDLANAPPSIEPQLSDLVDHWPTARRASVVRNAAVF